MSSSFFYPRPADTTYYNSTCPIGMSQTIGPGIFGVFQFRIHHFVLGIPSENHRRSHLDWWKNPRFAWQDFTSMSGTWEPAEPAEPGTGSPCLAPLLGHSTAAAGDFGTAGTDPWRCGGGTCRGHVDMRRSNNEVQWRWGFYKLNLGLNQENYWSGFGPYISPWHHIWLWLTWLTKILGWLKPKNRTNLVQAHCYPSLDRHTHVTNKQWWYRDV